MIGISAFLCVIEIRYQVDSAIKWDYWQRQIRVPSLRFGAPLPVGSPWVRALARLVRISDRMACGHDKMYRSHRVRITHQHRFIDDMTNGMEERCITEKGSDEAIIVIDYKINGLLYTTVKQHCSTSPNGVCPGLGLHIYYFEYNERFIAEKYFVKEAVRLDQILEETNIQTAVTVAFMIEAVLHQIAKELPSIGKLTLQNLMI